MTMKIQNALLIASAGILCLVSVFGFVVARHNPLPSHVAQLWMSKARINARAVHNGIVRASHYSAEIRIPETIHMVAPTSLPEIELVNGHIDRFNLSQLRGSMVLMFFGARDCSGGCEQVLSQLVAVKRELGDAARHVRFVMVGVDVQQDSPASLLRHVRGYDPDFMALTGAEAVVLPFATQHGIWVDVRRHSGSGRIDRFLPRGIYSLLISADGRWTTSFPYDLSPEEMADEIRSQMTLSDITGAI